MLGFMPGVAVLIKASKMNDVRAFLEKGGRSHPDSITKGCCFKDFQDGSTMLLKCSVTAGIRSPSTDV
jgi:hypothetical protein